MNRSWQRGVCRNGGTRSSLRCGRPFDNVEITVDLVRFVRNSQVLNPVEESFRSCAGTACISAVVVEIGPDENAISVHRQIGHIIEEFPPVVALKQIELNVRCVECRYRALVLLEVSADRPQRLASCEVSDNRDNAILQFEMLHRLEV